MSLTEKSPNCMAGLPGTIYAFGCIVSRRPPLLFPGLGRLIGLALDRGPDGEVADLDVVGLLDGEGDGARDGLGRDGELGHAFSDLLADLLVVDRVGELGADVARRDRGRADDPVGRLLAKSFAR